MPDSAPPQSSIILYQTEDGRTRIQCRFEDDTIWLTQALIADLFQIGVNTANHHLSELYEEGELEREATIRQYRIVRIEGSREVARDIEHYSLPVILAVGYRVRSHRGTQFRQWATARQASRSISISNRTPHECATRSRAMPSDICKLSAVDMARQIRAKALSAREVVSAHLQQIERINPSVNAIVTLVADQAMARAFEEDEAQARGHAIGPLHGLPIAHKDLQPTKGIRTTFGSPIFKDFIPSEDSLLVERIRQAGAIVVGKTNVPEFGAGSQTFNPVFGPTLNPYDPTKTCGGSTGGGAVALACGMLPLADGTDMGGSLRNPASFCNVVGLRPSPGRVPAWPTTTAWSTLSVDGPMARNVADVALLLSAIAGPDARSPIALADAGSVFARPLERDVTGVRIAWWKDLGGVPVDRRVKEVVNAQRAVFESLGCIVEEAEPDFAGFDEVFKTVRAVAYLTGVAERVAHHRHMIKDTILWELERGESLTPQEIVRAEVKRTEIYHRMRQFMERFDFFVLPATQLPPFDVDQPYPTEIEGVAMETYIDWMKSCYYISVVGNPAISVPCGFTAEGLPVGLQIVGRHRDDWGLLQMAHAFEQANGEKRRWPNLASM